MNIAYKDAIRCITAQPRETIKEDVAIDVVAELFAYPRTKVASDVQKRREQDIEDQMNDFNWVGSRHHY
jgi:hypothetical protein